jgi:hypothetical protein
MRFLPMHRRSALLLGGSLLAATLLALGLPANLQVLEVGGPDTVLSVSKGDVFFHEYTHSMYGVQVSEKFRIEDGHFRLVHVMTQSDAVLEYFGIEKRGEHNADGTFQEFTIPAASCGNHILRLHNLELSLGTLQHRSGRIHLKLKGVPVWAYVTRLIWR